MSEIEELTNRINELENKLVELEQKRTKHKTKSKVVNSEEEDSCDALHAEQQQSEPVSCEICHKTFKNKYTLKTHMRNKHNENRERFECLYCQKKLASKYYLITHISNIHSDEIELMKANNNTSRGSASPEQ